MESICEASISTGLGSFTVRCSERGLRELSFGTAAKTPKSRNGDSWRHDSPTAPNGKRARAEAWVRKATEELEEYAAGQRKKFTVPLDLDGTPFQKRVWKALLAIPYGETRSYGEIARQVGNPKAARAVGMANHENPVAIIVPCHRVIAGDGTLGGYGGGLQKKSRLLGMEKAHA